MPPLSYAGICFILFINERKFDWTGSDGKVNLMDIVIKNGLVVDGTGGKAYRADIGIREGKIAGLAPEMDCAAGTVIDGEGLVVAPGFIDVHSHNDLVPFMGEEIQKLKLLLGVTTELVGQCGLGVVPCEDGRDGLWKNYIRGVVGDPGMEWRFGSFREYREAMAAAGLKNNYGALISHGAVKARVMGFESREPTESELEDMTRQVREAMEEGAFGMSIGLQYMPAVFSRQEELVVLCRAVKSHEGIVMVHVRNHDSSIVNALKEITAVAGAAGVKLHISHLRSYNSKELGCSAGELLKFVEAAKEKGLSITFDEHLYLSGSTLMTQLLPPWLTGAAKGGLRERLKDPQVLKRLKEELADRELRYPGWDNYSAIAGWDGILLTSLGKPENLKYIGKTLGGIAAEEGLDPVDLMARLLVEEQAGIGIVTLNIFSEEDTIELIKHPQQMTGSDSIPAGVPHPRLYGNYPLFLGKFVREKKALSLEEAVYKSTLLPAQTLGMKEIGQLAVNRTADIILFDYDAITGYEDYRNPTRKPEGIRHVILNGKIAVRDGSVCEGSYGRALEFKSP